MGLINSSIRIRLLASQKMDLEYKMLLITQAYTTLGQSVQDLQGTGTDYTDPNCKEIKILNARVAELQLLEKRLQSLLNSYQERLKMIDTELESARQMRDKAIESAFKYSS